MDDGCIALEKRGDGEIFMDAAAVGRVWDREPGVRPPPAAVAKPSKKK
jgi:hypothetical protein